MNQYIDKDLKNHEKFKPVLFEEDICSTEADLKRFHNREAFSNGKIPLVIRRNKDNELITLNKDKCSYSLQISKDRWPNNLHSEWPADIFIYNTIDFTILKWIDADKV